MELINSSMRKVIKGMVVTCQTAQFVALMPKPKDFVQKVVQDVVYLSKRVQRLSNDINTLLDNYTDIPSEYILSTVSNITSTATGLVDKATSYATNPLTMATNSLELASTLTSTTIDLVDQTSQAVVKLSSTVAQAGTTVIGQTDIASDIKDASSDILEWTGNGFSNIKSTVTDSVNAVTDKINNVTNSITDKADSVNNIISTPQRWVENLLSQLKSAMDSLSSKLDSGFGDVTGVTSISKGANYVTNALKNSGVDNEATQAVSAVATSVENVLKNFSIAKVVTAFGGVLVATALVRTGLDELPAIDYESMLNKVRGKNKNTNDDLYNKFNALVSDTQSVLIPNDDRNYDSSQYKSYVKEFNDVVTKQREEIRLAMKNNTVEGKLDQVEVMKQRKELKSAIKEIKKFRKKAKAAKQSTKLIEEISNNLNLFKKDVTKRSKKIKQEWNDMMTQYKTAIKKMTTFFKSGGTGSLYIDDCCDKINEDATAIKELCQNLIVQLAASTVKVGVPSDIGMVAPNPVYKLADFWMDIKTIFKFIKELIRLIMDIISNINKIARLMINGLNKLADVVKNLMSLLGIQWLIDLIQSIIDLFGSKITDARALLENMVSPVYYSETDEYSNTLETLEAMCADNGTISISSEQYQSLSDSNRFYAIDMSSLTKAVNKNDTDTLEEILNNIDEAGDELVAYKSVILAPSDNDEDNNSVTVSSVMNGTNDIDSNVKVKGWIFYHPNLTYKGSTYYTGNGFFTKIIRKIKEKIIKKASKTGNKKRGGVNMLKRKKVKKDSAYKAFYWYTYYTDDLEEDGFDQSTAQDAVKIGSTISTENGTIVELTDGRKVFVNDVGIKSGDYVTVDGTKYRVK